MSSSITTLVTLMESLPEDLQERIVEHVREYVADLQDERRWDETFKKSQSQLIAAARRAKQEIAEGKATPMDYDQL